MKRLPSLSPIVLAIVLLSGSLSVARDQKVVLVEAEGFSDLGGWVLDPQFMDIMGSPYLLAHGLGKPVVDAKTTVAISAAGRYRVWVRTKDWVAHWNAPGTPGRFQVLINGRALDHTFGTVGADWHWQDGGVVTLSKGRTDFRLHDLTGFEGRCDAILLSADPDFEPPNAGSRMAAFRRDCLGFPVKPERAGDYDLVVTGGGIAGTCTALSAARLGMKVALVQDRPVLGGNNSSEVRVWLQGARSREPWPRVGDIVAELEQDERAHYGPTNKAELYEDDKKLALVRAEPNIDLFLEHRVNGVEAGNGTIKAVIAQDVRSGRRFSIKGRWFADCTGDGSVGVLAEADFDMQPKGHMGPCNLWNVCECEDTQALNTDSEVTVEAAPFPRCPWALDLSDKPFPGRSKTKPDPLKLGGWYWESGFDRDPIAEMEYVRDWNFRAMYGAWDALKNVDKVLPRHELNWSAFILGKRESRRLLGDVILTLDDLIRDRQFPDGCAPTGWSNDLHLGDPRYGKGFEGDEFIARAQFGKFPAHEQGRPFWIPYRCLYSRNVANLLMAGRNISVTHDALGAVRVMRTCGTEGEIIGMAASLCKKYDVNPREIYEHHLQDLQELMRRGLGEKNGALKDYTNGGERRKTQRPVRIATPSWLKEVGDNLARSARVSTPGTPTKGIQTSVLLNDGNGKVEDNSARWMNRANLPHTVEFTWDRPVELAAARIISGYYSGGTVIGPLQDFSLQWHDGTEWKNLLANVEANTNPAWSAQFSKVRTQRIRLLITKTVGNISRVWEVEFYGPSVEARNKETSS
ncbi:MAG: FAD-dependent oxidoreductase [Fuerstiella sp.]|nr:FAD-dependent oxidoreductase [Fuerstiella sp.]MCP4855805.1 FAD-dependent oxidoreductase [Fuerstiella sp.]